MLITAFVFTMIAVVLGIAFLRGFAKQLADHEDRSHENHPHHLKEAASIEAAQELYPFEETKSTARSKTEPDKKRSHLQVVPDIKGDKAKSSVQPVTHKADAKAKNTAQTVTPKADAKTKTTVQPATPKVDAKAKTTVQTVTHKADAKAKTTVLPVTHKVDAKATSTVEPFSYIQVPSNIPPSFIANERPNQPVLSQSIEDSAAVIPLSLEKQLDNIEVTESRLQINVYNTLVQQLEEASAVVTQIDEQIKFIELTNFIDDEFTKLSTITERQENRA
ncbi:hypothetical protein [Paenibacillus elgii]|uniref:hypothetical protein n=1 Tax=Paenibacillus elgii TaxID=189691 RepID=UPI00203D96A9|nr:hypothetical protein [Paenibacillus elgii]MCM3271658.1 hypothetical protein [Paenibacillus elgii]